MPKVSINILTKNRAEFLKKALLSISRQSYTDYEIVAVNDGSADDTNQVLQEYKGATIRVITHEISKGITAGRQEALFKSTGEYIAILDDDDVWSDAEKLEKQVKYLDEHLECVLAGGLKKEIIGGEINSKIIYRPETDENIRRTMLFRNNFFTSAVVFRREAAMKAGGFIKDQDDFAEDYDLWLRIGKIGKMYNFQEVFTLYMKPNYNKHKFKAFLNKQRRLIGQYRKDYPGYFLAAGILKIRNIL